MMKKIRKRKNRTKTNKNQQMKSRSANWFLPSFFFFFSFAHFTRLYLFYFCLSPPAPFQPPLYYFNYHLRNFQWWFDSKKRWLAQNATEIGFQLLYWLQTKSLYNILFCISCVAEELSFWRKSLDSTQRGRGLVLETEKSIPWLTIRIPAVTPAPYLITPNCGFFHWKKYRKSYTLPSVSVFWLVLSSSL